MAIETRRLEELVACVAEKTGPSKDPAWRYIGLEHIGQNGMGFQGSLPSAASTSINSIFNAGDVLFGKLRPNLRKCELALFDGCCSTDILVQRTNSQVSSQFAARVFQSDHVGRLAERTAAGTKMPRTSWRDIRRLETFFPARRAQDEIANILNTLDTTIRQTEAIIEKLKLVKRGLLHDLMTRGIWAAHYSNDGSLFIRSQNVRMGYLDFNDRQLVRPPLGAEGERTRVVAGDLLVTITGNGVGNISHVSEHWNEQAFVSQHVGLIRFFEPRLGRQAMLYFLEGSPGHKQLSEAQYGQSKPGLSLKNLCELQLPIQLYGEQIEVAASLDKSQVRIDAELEYLAKLRQMKSGLMDDLVTGRVRVTPLLTAT